MNYSSIIIATDTSSTGYSLLIIFINPPIYCIQQWKKIITNLDSFSDPHNPITFLPPNPLSLLPVSFILPATLTHNSHVQEHSFTIAHTHTQEKVHTDRNIHTETNTHNSGVGGYQFDTGHCDYLFSVLQSGARDKRPADCSKAKHLSSYSDGEVSVKVVVAKDLYLNRLSFSTVKNQFSDQLAKWGTKWRDYWLFRPNRWAVFTLRSF